MLSLSQPQEGAQESIEERTTTMDAANRRTGLETPLLPSTFGTSCTQVSHTCLRHDRASTNLDR
jgi:hypothetical protein